MAKIKNKIEKSNNSLIEEGLEETIQKPIQLKKLSAKDFCDSKKGLKYKERVFYVLNRKYPNQIKSIPDWENILVSDEII